MNIKELDLSCKSECDKWEKFVINNGFLYQSVKWCEVLKEGYNIDSLYLYLEDNGEIVSLLPLFRMKLPFLIDELVSIPHVEAGGFINPEYYKYFFDYLEKQRDFKNFKIYQLNEEIGDFPKNDTNSVFMVKIPENMEGVFAYIKKGIKRSIKNIIDNSDIDIVKGNSDEYINVLYNFNVRRNKEFGTPHHSFAFLNSLVKKFKDDSVIFVAKKNGVPLGVAFVLFYGKIAYHFYHFIPTEYWKFKVGYILYFYLVKESFERGMETFSFGRSPKGSGVYKFKIHMQATPYPLYVYNFEFRDNKLKGEKIKILSEKYSWAANIWSKLPMPVTNFLSPRLRKWIY